MDKVRRAKRCLDTYALMEIFYGNPNHEELLREPFLIPDLVLVELYDVLARTKGAGIAEEWQARYALHSVPVPRDILMRAVELRQSRKKLDLSLTDAAGYCLARHLGIPFVTGDKAFRQLPGVDFRPSR